MCIIQLTNTSSSATWLQCEMCTPCCEALHSGLPMQSLLSSPGKGSFGFLLRVTEAVELAQDKMPDPNLLCCAAVNPAVSKTTMKSHSIWLHTPSYASVLYIPSCSAGVQVTEAVKIAQKRRPDLNLKGTLLCCAAVDPALSQTEVDSHSIWLHRPSYASVPYITPAQLPCR